MAVVKYMVGVAPDRNGLAKDKGKLDIPIRMMDSAAAENVVATDAAAIRVVKAKRIIWLCKERVL